MGEHRAARPRPQGASPAVLPALRSRPPRRECGEDHGVSVRSPCSPQSSLSQETNEDPHGAPRWPLCPHPLPGGHAGSQRGWEGLARGQTAADPGFWPLSPSGRCPWAGPGSCFQPPELKEPGSGSQTRKERALRLEESRNPAWRRRPVSPGSGPLRESLQPGLHALPGQSQRWRQEGATRRAGHTGRAPTLPTHTREFAFCLFDEFL